MSPLFKKLNFKDQKTVVLINAPDSFSPEIGAMTGLAEFRNGFEKGEKAGFALAFATQQAELDALAVLFSEKTAGDVVLWVAFPKGSSKKLRCDFNRDTGWALFGKMGFEPVRSVAVDEDWTALRLRRVEFIKEMTRSFSTADPLPPMGAKDPSRPVEVPQDFAAALERSPEARAIFEKYAYTHRKEYVRWIEDAKRAETRAGRIEKAVAMLLEKRKLS